MRVLIPLLIVYVVAVTWQMRRSLAVSEPQLRLREAKRLLIIVSAGVPLAAAFILVAM